MKDKHLKKVHTTSPLPVSDSVDFEAGDLSQGQDLIRPSFALQMAKLRLPPMNLVEDFTQHLASSSPKAFRKRLGRLGGSHHIQFNPPHDVLARQIDTPIEQRAACFLVSNFVLPSKSDTRSYSFAFMGPFLGSTDEKGNLAYDAAFQAVALASLSSNPSYRNLLPLAETKYVKALNELNLSLHDPKRALDDSTLASTLLMALYELVVPSDLRCPGQAERPTYKAWASHISGAVQLVKARGKAHLQTRIGRELFVAVRSLMVSCHSYTPPLLQSGEILA
jgi:hypothetical protein